MKSKSKPNQKSNAGRYSAEFIGRAIGLAQTIGYTAAARQLGIHATQIHRWEKSPAGTKKSESNDVAFLRKEVERLSEELEFLKKAEAYFNRKPE